MKKVIIVLVLVLVVFVVGIQFVPYGRDHQNPPVIKEPPWDTTQTRALAKRACFNCHSNETIWPWYSNIAPSAWLVQRDVNEARRKLNFSEWGQREQEVDEIPEIILSGEMPPSYYLIMHPEAKLNQAEIQALVAGLSATIGASTGGD